MGVYCVRESLMKGLYISIYYLYYIFIFIYLFKRHLNYLFTFVRNRIFIVVMRIKISKLCFCFPAFYCVLIRTYLFFQSFVVFGTDIAAIPCFRSSLLTGAGGGALIGLGTFLLTSRVRLASHVGYAGFVTTTLSYW